MANTYEDRKLAIEAFTAAADCVNCGDPDSALEYATVAILAILSDSARPGFEPVRFVGKAILYGTADAATCIECDTIDLPGEAAPGARAE